MAAMRPWVSMAPYHGAMASPGDMVLVPVMQLRFTHDKIRPVFRKGNHRGQPLYELVNDLFRGIVNPAVNLPPLEIYFHKGVWRSLNNRRLWALKAYMGLSGNFQLMVRAFISTCSPVAFRARNSTRTEGLSVEVNGDGVEGVDVVQEAFYGQTPAPCRFWQHGECFRADSCPYSHEDPEPALMPEDKLHLSAARRLLGKIYQKCCARTAEIQRCARESNENELEAMEQCIGSLSQVLDASCDFPSPALALTPTEPPTRPLENQREVPVPPRAVAPAQFLDGDDRLACPTALPAAPRNQPPVTPVTPTCPPTWSPTVEMGIPPPPAIPPPQPQHLDLTERLSGFRSDAFETKNRATPAASSVAAQLFSMPAVVPDHTKMFDELGWTPPQAPARQAAATTAAPTKAAGAVAAAASAEERRWPATVPVDASTAPTLNRSATAPVAKASRATMKEVVSRGAVVGACNTVNAKLAPRPKPKLPPSTANSGQQIAPIAQRAGLQADVTGVLVKHLPSVLSQSQLLRALGEDGFDGQIDYCSLPEFQDSQGPRQAWLNFRRPSFAQELWHAWHGRRRFKQQEVALQVVQSPYQGLEENLKRCNMHQDEMPFVALDALTAAQPPEPPEPPEPELAERGERGGASSSASRVKRSERPERSERSAGDLHDEGVWERKEGPRGKQKERIKHEPTPKDPPLRLEAPPDADATADVVDATADVDVAPTPKGEAQARSKVPVRKAKGSCAKKDEKTAASRRVEENFDRLLAEERSKHSCDLLEGGQPVSDHCCLCGKTVANLKPALELSVCKAHYRMFQSEERFLATFVAARQKSDPKAPSNHLFHLSAYLNRGEESPFISDLYLGGGIAELSLLIRFLSARGHGLEERWHGLTAPFMSFILLDYAPFLAVAFADVLEVDCSRYPCILDIRARARSAMCRWSPSKRLSGLTGDALDQTVAEAVSASHDLRLPAEHMPLDTEIGSSKRKKKKKLARTTAAPAATVEAASVPPATDSQAQPAMPLIESTQETHHETHESDLNDEREVPALCMAHHTWQWLTCSDVFKWAMASKKQARDYYRLSTCSCCEHVAPWSFLQDEDLPMDDQGKPLESLGVLELPDPGPAGDLVPDAAAFTESEGHTVETAESEESDQSDCSSQISTADLPSAPKEKSAEPQGKADGVPAEDRGGAALATAHAPHAPHVPHGPVEPQVVAAPPVTFKGVLRQLLQQLHGLQNLARQHPFWLHTTLSESFHLSACSKAHAALFEEAAALAVLRRQQQLRGEICDVDWEEDLSDGLIV